LEIKKIIMGAILITGGCGFIGTSLIDQLQIQAPHIKNIRILDNLSEGSIKDLSEVTEFSIVAPENCSNSHGVVLIEGDICDQKIVNLCAENVDCIIHLAANTGVAPSVENPRMDMESNVIGTFNMLEAARKNKVKKFIFASSGAPAGMVTPPIHEELPPHPVSPYGASKLAGEGYCSAYYYTFGINTVCLRFGNVYGPRSKNKSSVVAKFIRQSLVGEKCHIYGDGTQTRDFIYIDDLVTAIVLSISHDVGGETFQIASGIEKTVDEVAHIIKGVLGQHGKDMIITYESPRIGDVKRNYSDTSKAKKVLGWHPLTNLQSGIDNTVKYFIDMTNE
jgi:UDP-glucose 4-epimerase